ncbi:MAG: glycosyltransferase family 4 protein [bacterium]
MIEGLVQESPHINCPPLEDYSIENRKANFAYLAEGKKKILIVSDFKNRIGGIETYINDAKKILEESGYEVQIYGAQIPGGKRGKIVKILGIIAAIFNVREANKLAKKIQKEQPDIIRFNSVLRYIGRLPLRTSRKNKAEKRMMYHDLGYFYPFPRKLEQETDIKYPFTFKNFIKSAKTKNPIIILASTGKYLLLKLIQNQLKKRIKKHLVPSPFMKPIVHKSFAISEEDITVFPHFIQE